MDDMLKSVMVKVYQGKGDAFRHGNYSCIQVFGWLFCPKYGVCGDCVHRRHSGVISQSHVINFTSSV